MNYVEYKGYKFIDNGRGYYSCPRAAKILGSGLLHRLIWMEHYGPIPDGHQIHHKDHDRTNNDVTNLERLTQKEHSARHDDGIITEKQKAAMERNLPTLHAANKQWRESKEGKEWRKSNWATSIGKSLVPKQHTCIWCGKEYETVKTPKDPTRTFCSRKCGAAERRAGGLDDVDVVCERCGATYRKNKYSAKRYCGGCV